MTLSGVLGALACAPQPRVTPLAAACAPITERPADDISSDGLTGRYRWQFIVTDGPTRGRDARGILELRAFSAERAVLLMMNGKVHPRMREPYYGWTDLPFEDLGAYTEGTTTSRDSMAPGIAVRETRWTDRSPRVTLDMVLGSDRTMRDSWILHGAYISVMIEERTSSGFRGRWEAALDQTDYRMSGHYCAERIEDGTERATR